MKKVALIDDEQAARQLLREYLQAYPELIVIGEANNGVDAVKLIDEFKPDLVFLDVQMPGLNGFEVLGRIAEVPNIIFSTAYDQYALQAFEVNAIDYLLKPYTRERFDVAIGKVLSATEKNHSELEKLTMHLLENKNANSHSETILVRSGNKYVTLRTEEIICVSAEKDYSVLVTDRGQFLSSFGIGVMEERLDTGRFMRIHRSTIVNITHITEVEKHQSTAAITLSNGEQVRVSRSYMDQLKKITF